MRTLLTLLCASLVASPAFAAGDQMPNKRVDWPFDGMTGKVDRASAQRGLQVYREVCAACHGAKIERWRKHASTEAAGQGDCGGQGFGKQQSEQGAQSQLMTERLVGGLIPHTQNFRNEDRNGTNHQPADSRA